MLGLFQGHAEVVQLELGDDTRKEFAAFADKYFDQFVKTPFGMMRQVCHAWQPQFDWCNPLPPIQASCEPGPHMRLHSYGENVRWYLRPLHFGLPGSPGRRSRLQECHRPARRCQQPAVQGSAGSNADLIECFVSGMQLSPCTEAVALTPATVIAQWASPRVTAASVFAEQYLSTLRCEPRHRSCDCTAGAQQEQDGAEGGRWEQLPRWRGGGRPFQHRVGAGQQPAALPPRGGVPSVPRWHRQTILSGIQGNNHAPDMRHAVTLQACEGMQPHPSTPCRHAVESASRITG